MEIHRLKSMGNYDKDLFERLYQKTQSLRNSLVFSINPHYVGVSKDVVYSWFDDKFIHVFNKYCNVHDEEVLKGHLINGLQNFKRKILMKVKKNEDETNFYLNRIELTDNHDFIIPLESESDNSELLIELIWSFFEKHLSPEEFSIFKLTINPPSFIHKRLGDLNRRIPTPLILEYLGHDPTDCKLRRRVNRLRKNIDNVLYMAKNYFNSDEMICHQ